MATPTGPSASITASPDTVTDDQGNVINYLVSLQWSAADNSAGQAPSSYILQMKGGDYLGHDWGSPELLAPYYTTTSTSLDFGELQTGDFRVQAQYPNGTVSAWAESGPVTEGGEAYTQVQASVTSISDTEVDLSMVCNPQVYDGSQVLYNVAYAPYNSPAQDGNAVGFTRLSGHTTQGDPGVPQTVAVTGLTPGVKYDFLVVAIWQYPPGVGSYGDIHGDLSSYSTAHLTATTTGGDPTVPAVPGAVGATWYASGGQADVAVHWLNNPNNETAFLVQRSLNGGGFTTIATVAADVTTYTDASVPLNPQGDANVEYQILAADGGVQSTPSAPAAANIKVTSVTKTKAVLVERWPSLIAPPLNGATRRLTPARKSVNGFDFVDEIQIWGTNLQNVKFMQFMNNTTTLEDPATGVPRPLTGGKYSNPIYNSSGWVPDGNLVGNSIKPMKPTVPYWTQSGGAFAIVTEDKHNEGYPYLVYEAPSPLGGTFPVRYVPVFQHVSQFQDYFTYPDPTATNPENTRSTELDWGYSWTNSGYQAVDDLPPLPSGVSIAASPEAFGSPAGILTGNNIDLGAAQYVADIQHPSGH